MNILDMTVVENDTMSLQNAFRSWLHDSGTDSEHLHLILPHPPSLPQTAEVEGGEDEEYDLLHCGDMEGDFGGGMSVVGGAKRRRKEEQRELVMKCDLQERILDPMTAFDPKISSQFVSH